ncbi:MAG: type IV toxin-antitoxin system AbiEi family antitoxin domain-containing protein [Acidimicrobiia bacterium]|nr:type IV toxin-antitoxin system AbiEi family antitoxin domain-containing protein [Acidimicrobiia bacterium]
MSDWRIWTMRDFEAEGRTRSWVRRAVARGEYIRAARGVFVPGARPADPVERWVQDCHVAVVARPGDTLTGESAAGMLSLDGFQPGDFVRAGPVALQLPQSGSARWPGGRRLARLAAPTTAAGLPISAVEEVLLAVADQPGPAPRPGCRAATTRLDVDELVELALEDALRRELVTLASLAEVIEAASWRRPGAAVLDAVLRRRGAAAPTESYLETRCVQELRRAGLPAFERQQPADAPVGSYRVDLVLDGVAIEPMGLEYHGQRVARDARRHSYLAGSGLTVIPVTFADVEFRPAEMVRNVRSALARSRASQATA